MEQIYLTTEELSSKIKYDPRTIRKNLRGQVACLIILFTVLNNLIFSSNNSSVESFY